MKLISITYSSKDLTNSDDWKVNNLKLKNSNLIVGKNAAGKSRVAQLIASFAKMIAQQGTNLFYGEWDVFFETNSYKKLRYHISVSGLDSVQEKITIEGKELLFRNLISTKIYSSVKSEFITIHPPDNKLILHIRRDKEEFPFLEEIVEWAEQTYGFKFGNITPYSYLIDRESDRLTSIDNIPKLLEELRDFNNPNLSKSYLDNILKDFNSLGYEVTDIKVSTTREKNILLVKEENLNHYLPQNSLSQGMFRSLALIIFIEYITSIKKVSIVIIDDLCEGLDYERAKALGELIFSKNERSEFQLIATTNDSFLMDCVDIENWNVLIRKDGVVEALNYNNNTELFKEFKYTGLSNFDLFSSDYLLNK